MNSGLSAYTVPEGVAPNNQTIFTGPQGDGFPVTWDPRYTIANGWAAIPDHRENYEVPQDHERVPAVSNSSGYFFNPADSPRGFAMTGNLDTGEAQGVHSLVCPRVKVACLTDRGAKVDVPVYAWVRFSSLRILDVILNDS